MATTTYGNVINLQPGGPRVTVAANRVLVECRDLASRRLRETLREIIGKLPDELFERSGDATGDERKRLDSLRDTLIAKGSRLEGQVAGHWSQEFDAVLRGPKASSSGKLLLEDLQIVDFGEVDEDLAMKSLVRRLQDKCESDLYALGRRFNALAGREGDAEGDNPMAPEVLMRALKGALRDADFESGDRLEFCRSLEPVIELHIGPIYHAVNAHLVKHNVLPDLRRDYGRASAQSAAKKRPAGEQVGGDMFALLQNLVAGTGPAASGLMGMAGAPMLPGTGQPAAFAGGGMAASVPHVWASLEALQHAVPVVVAAQPGVAVAGAVPANVLHDFRASEVGQGLGQLDAITVDIVAMLFDMIFDDREISDPIKALVGKLQIPVLKVAMLDRSFFSSKAHPTRRLLDLISRAALRWGRQVGRDDPIFEKIAEVIEHVHGEFKQDTALFETLCNDLEAFLKRHEEAAAGNINRAALLVVQRELEELAEMAVDGELQLWLGGELPAAVGNLLDREWRAVLKRIHLDDGPGSEAWNNALKTAADLVDSVRPKRDMHERQALAKLLPVLIKQLSVGFDRVGVDGDRRRALLDALFSLHAASLRGTEPPAAAFEAPPVAVVAAEEMPDLASQSLADGEITVESISITAPLLTTAPSADVSTLQRGDWVEYMQPDGSPLRYRLSWVSPQRGIFLFTNPQSPNALAVSPEAMSLQVERGEVRILPTEPMFDRALTRTIDLLQAA